MLVEKKETHSKLRNLNYHELKIQNYLLCQEISVHQAKILLKFRTRMANYGNNFLGNNEIKHCKLCESHPDSQDKIYDCKFNQQNIKMSGKYEDIFDKNISPKLVKMLEEISKKREEKLR